MSKIQSLISLTLLLGFFFCCSSPCQGQPKKTKVLVEKVIFGFRNYQDNGATGVFKAGCWTPVYVNFLTDAKSFHFTLPLNPDGFSVSQMGVTVNDGDNIQSTYMAPMQVGRNSRATVLSYINPTSNPEPAITVFSADGQKHKYDPQMLVQSVSLNEHIYVTIGSKIPELRQALMDYVRNKELNETHPRNAGFETQVDRLPDHWFGYQGVDFAILTTGNTKFITDLQNDDVRVEAIARWIRQGGRLLISISPQNLDLVQSFLTNPKWQPSLPKEINPQKTKQVTSMESLQNWENRIRNNPFPVNQTRPEEIAELKSWDGAEILIQERKDPLMVRIPYGRGNLTLLAFELERGPFKNWGKPKNFGNLESTPGNVLFLKNILNELGPKVMHNTPQGQGQVFIPETNSNQDVSTHIHRNLDNFDVPVISFGWVALFILIYIIIVGPIDYLILKKVFKRLELTWITFPSVVILISILAYFTAYAIKGNDLKINKIDLVDIDMRSALDENYKTKKAYAYGTSWFSILSPRIQNYDIGLEPRLDLWGDTPGEKNENNEVMITWFGRPEYNVGFGGRNSQSLFSRAYTYAEGAKGINKVPIPVWTSKAFSATWEDKFGKLPIQADLYYRPTDINQTLYVNIENQLPFALKDVHLVYGKKIYKFSNKLPAKGNNSKVEFKLQIHQMGPLNNWISKHATPQINKWGHGYQQQEETFSPYSMVQQLYFLEQGGMRNNQKNHVQRMLDQSWRLKNIDSDYSGVRTAILIARLPNAQGSAENLTASDNPILPTHLWLYDIPEEGNTRPTLLGTLNQETYVLVFLPVRPKQ